MIDPSQPLGHSIVVGVFRFQCEIEEPTGDRLREAARTSPNATIGSDSAKIWIAIMDEAKSHVVVQAVEPRRAEHSSDEVVVDVRRPYAELTLLQPQNSVMVPGGLPESGKSDRVYPKLLSIGVSRLCNIGKKLGTVQLRRGYPGFKHYSVTN